MEDKDIKILEEKIDKGYIYVNCGNETEKAIINLLQAYKQDEKIIDEMAKVMCKFDCIPSKVTNYKDLIDYFRKKCD